MNDRALQKPIQFCTLQALQHDFDKNIKKVNLFSVPLVNDHYQAGKNRFNQTCHREHWPKFGCKIIDFPIRYGMKTVLDRNQLKKKNVKIKIRN